MRKKKENLMADTSVTKPVSAKGRKSSMASVTQEKQADGCIERKCRKSKRQADKNDPAGIHDVMLEHERLLGEVKHLRMLLASFNALTSDDGVKLETPVINTPYWYIRPTPIGKSFEVISCQWNNWRSDHYRYVQGNMFLDLGTANIACIAMNKMLAALK